MSILLLTAQLLVGGVFSFAGGRKLTDIPSFYRSILAFELLPPFWAHIFAYVLPGAELFAGILLLVGVITPVGGILVLAMLIGFSIVLTLAYAQRKSIDCGCFGTSDIPTSYGQALFRNGMLSLLALFIIIGVSQVPQRFLWQVMTTQDMFALPTSVGLVIAFRLGILIWNISRTASPA